MRVDSIKKGSVSILRNAFSIGLCLLAHVSLATCVHAQSADRPNVVVFLVDDMGVMDTSVPFLCDEKGTPKRYPLNDHYRTPSMERLAEQGIRFSQFYAMSVCSPTRISIMTGQNAARHRTTNWINPAKDNAGPLGAPDWNWAGLRVGDVTLPGLLRKAGYRTIHIGKGHFGPDGHEGAEPLNLGFDVNVGGASFGAPGSYYGEKHYGARTPRKQNAVPHLDAYHESDTFLTEALTLEAKKRVTESVQRNEPFFLYFAQYAVHSPFESDPRFADHYAESGKPEKAQAFATLIEGMDKSLGDLLDHLNRLQVAEKTLVVFLGDNGSDAPLGHPHEVACAAPLRGKKGSHYEGGMRVPFIAAWAKPDATSALQSSIEIATGEIQTQVASVEDLLPTILEWTGVTAPEGHLVDGTSLRTLLSGQRDPNRKEQFLMHYPHAPHRSNYFTVWRDGDWKVIYHLFPEVETAEGHRQLASGHYELFNLAEDPFESTNLAEKEPSQLATMMRGLIDSLEGHDAVYAVDQAGNEARPSMP